MPGSGTEGLAILAFHLETEASILLGQLHQIVRVTVGDMCG
jgi:hypothetical protein